MYVPWLADAARTTGYQVVEVAGWRTRGHGGMRLVEGIVGHHTATPATAAGDYPSLGIVTNGRSDLAGPLANLGLGRNGTIYVIAAGASWHAGASAWAGFADLNDEFLGIEAESPGYGEWTAAQKDAYPKLVGALLRYMNRPVSRYAGHKDVCLPVGRKVDPRGVETAWMQTTANTFINPPPGTTPDVQEEDDLMLAPAADDDYITVPCNGKTLFFIAPAYGRTVEILAVTAVKDNDGSGNPAYTSVQAGLGVANSDQPGPISIGGGCRHVVLRYRANHPFTVWCA